MNTLKQEANTKFEDFFNTVNPDILSIEAIEVLMTAPTKWTRFIEMAVFNCITSRLEDVEEREQFTSVFRDLSERIAISTSLAQFVEWLHEVSLSFDARQGTLVLENSILSRDAYEVLELFVEKFYE